MRRVLPVASLLIVTACVSTERLRQSRGSGELRCYKGEFELIWGAVEQSIVRNGLLLLEADTLHRTVIARSAPEPRAEDPKDMAMDSNAGERVAVFVDSAGPAIWSVEVVSRRFFALDPSPRDWTDDVFEVLEAFLPDSAARPWHYEYPRCLPRSPVAPIDSATSAGRQAAVTSDPEEASAPKSSRGRARRRGAAPSRHPVPVVQLAGHPGATGTPPSD